MSRKNEQFSDWVLFEKFTKNKAVAEFKSKIREAHRFVIDSNVAQVATSYSDGSGSIPLKKIDYWRTHAFAPHALTWIEYKCRRWNHDTEWGFLIEGHPTNANVFRMSVICRIFNSAQHTRPLLYGTRLVWSIESPPNANDEGYDSLPDWKPIDSLDRVNSIMAPWTVNVNPEYDGMQHYLFGDHGWLAPDAGTPMEARLIEKMAVDMWSLLALINNVPTIIQHVSNPGTTYRTGKIRKYLDFRTVTINVPTTQTLYDFTHSALMKIRRRGHKVRSHTRIYHRGKPDQYERRIPEHQRGDPTLGFVHHDYEVKKA